MKIVSIVAEVERHGPPLVSCTPILVLDLLATVRAGFPSPAEDHGSKRIDLTAKLTNYPQATFLVKARGESMKEVGIFDGDVLVVDRAGRMKLKAVNPGHRDIVSKLSHPV